MSKLNRRDFLKALGVTGGASALSACGWDNNRYVTPVEHILPYVVKPDQVTPGTYTFFATTVLSGPEARTVTARHRDGRVTFISHNASEAASKLGRSAVGSGSLLALQRHHNPDRITGASLDGKAIDWQEGAGKVADAFQAARSAGKRVAILSNYRSGSFVDLARKVAGDGAIFWEPLGYEADANASEALFGTRSLPSYHLDKAGYVLSFGAPFLSGWGDASLEEKYAAARNPNIGKRVARFALVSAFRDQTGSNADDWYAAKPGTEVGVARAIASLIAEKNGAPQAIKDLIGAVDTAAAAAAAGLEASALEAIAANFLGSEGVALPGGASGSTDLAVAVYLINLAAGAAPTRFSLDGYAGPIDGLAKIKALLDDAKAGKVGLLLIDDVDLAYDLPMLDVAGALKAVDLVVSMSSFPNATAKLASLILPTSGTLEDWGDEHPSAGVHLMRQPAMSPLHDTRSFGDLLLSLQRMATPDVEAVKAIPLNWAEYVQAWWQANVAGGDASEDTWSKHVVEGVAFTATPAAIVPTPTATSYTFAESAAFAGDLALYTESHPFWRDGRYANEPWAQETPDPMTGNVWCSWLALNPEDAKAKGLARGSLVTLKTAAGSVDVGVEHDEALGHGVGVLFYGKGKNGSGRYADGYGVNAATLFAEPANGAWSPIAASLTAAGAEGGLITLFSTRGTSDESRHFLAKADAAKLAEHGDAESEEPGHLTGIHEMPMDERLRAKGEGYLDFFPTPQHPTYRFGMSIDTNACNGCGACVIACNAENNIAIVGPKKSAQGKHMHWLRINRYWNYEGASNGEIYFLPMMCQHCGRAGCESVCPVLATYHNLDGLNAMVYNRCVGTRYCSNACPYSVRRFNFHSFSWPESFRALLNPDVGVRQMGVMEKCTFCVQRVRQTKSAWKDREGFTAVVPDAQWENTPACAEACPSHAITFGNLKDANGKVSKAKLSARAWQPLAELNTESAVTYLAKASFHQDPTAAHHGAAHGHAETEQPAHAEAPAGAHE